MDGMKDKEERKKEGRKEERNLKKKIIISREKPINKE